MSRGATLSRCVAASALVFAGLALLAGLLLVRGGISARAAPSPLETRLARTLRGWAIPRAARAVANPVPAGPQSIARGLAHFADHCASCHGDDGRGRTELGRGLYPRPPDLRQPATQRLTDGELFYIIENGVRFTGMPGLGAAGTAEGSWQLVRFVRHLPDLTDQELERMEALNPRSPAAWRELEDEDAFLRGERPAPAGPRPGDHAH